ncbi:MAG TPA: ABC transporter ATP-binding protein [Vicinamibacterales bacterium]|jgi:ABC-type polysaccharide/polyol phosphate transport system ATPase subunit|nr:ABC transporter ATP-binding protein [Vicinamibacterales bacterium]
MSSDSGPARHAIIVADRLGKAYALGGHRPNGVLRDSLVAGVETLKRTLRGGHVATRTPRDMVTALDDVSFTVPEGDVVGIVGRNGSGKSTLLKILARITEPTHGEAIVRGRIGALLEVGSGFHPELTGRENVFINGSILGMKRREIVRRFDDIVAFAGVERFLDTPVKHYSSGMQMRLAFAVAAHLEAHILLVDEVLAVGDAEFQRKCLGKMQEVSRAGRTVVLVSHQMGQIRRLCRTVLWLDRGRVRQIGPAEDVLHAYESASASAEPQSSGGTFAGWALGDGTTYLADGARPFSVRVRLGLRAPIRNGHLRLALLDPGDEVVAGWGFDALALDPATPYVDVAIPQLPLRPGAYRWTLALYDDGNAATGGRLIEQWTAVPELRLGGTPYGHVQDAWAGWLNVPVRLRVPAPTGDLAAASVVSSTDAVAM